MNFYNIKISIKNLAKNKLISAINIGGLALGIVISLLVFSYVNKEKNMDQEIPEIENTYTLLTDGDPDVSSAMVRHIRKEIPEIKSITYARYTWSPQDYLISENKNFKLNKLLIADSCFFRVFKFESVFGNLEEALLSANKIVITQSVANKIFGKENPVGKELEYNATYLQNEIVEIGAVIKDFSHNCSWEFDAVISHATNLKIPSFKRNEAHWGTQNYSAFVKIPSNISANIINEKLKNISTKNIPEGYRDQTKFEIQPFTKAYSNLPRIKFLKHGNQLTLTIIQITGILILLLACINYINLVTAQKIKRLRNIGILKVMGGKKGKIIELLAVESGLVLLITSVLVLILSYYLLLCMNQITNSKFTFLEIFSGSNLIIFISLLTFTFILTGIVPGITLSKGKTTALLKNTTSTRSQNHLRSGLLIFQFTITIVLLCGILFINKQNNYMSEMDPGFKREQILYATTNPQIKNSIDAFNTEIKRIPEIADLTYSSSLLGYNQSNWGLTMKNNGVKQEIGFANLYISPNFFDFFGINLVRGAKFNQYSVENSDWIFNSVAIKNFNIKNLEDATINFNNKIGKVIAEVEDFNHESMHTPIRPIAFRACGNSDEVVYFKINTGNSRALEQGISSITKVWKDLSPNFPIEINYMDHSWEALYEKERQFQEILNYATAISIILSCLGLVSITFFIVESQTKEIGLRKVNGAKPFEIVRMLNKGFTKWVAIAFVIACPIAYLAMNKWLENFAYRTELSWWIFALAGIIAMGIALLTVSFQSWRVATRNPVESLRYE